MFLKGKLISTGVVLTAAILATALYFARPWAEEAFFRSNGKHHDLPSLDETQVPERAPDERSAENPRAPDLLAKVGAIGETTDQEAAVRAVARRVFSANSAVEMDQALDELALYDPEYAEWRRSELPSFCHPEVIKHGGNSAIKAAKEKFCADFDHAAYARPSLDAASLDISDGENIDALVEYLAHAEERQAMNPTERFASEIRTALESAPESHWSGTFTDLVRNAQFPDELLMLNLHNQDTQNSVGMPRWRFGEALRQSIYPEANLLNAQNVALHLHTCRQFGGCGRNGYLTMMHCSVMYSGKCRPGSSFEDVLYQTTPPADFGLAMEIAARL